MVKLSHMIDVFVCPICFSKLESIRRTNIYVHYVNNVADYFEKNCKYGYHTFQFFLNIHTNEIDFIHFSITPYLTTYMHIDLLNEKSKIVYFKNGIPQEIHMPGIIQPDFPRLLKLQEKASKYVLFS
jgi:hypothetical protein